MRLLIDTHALLALLEGGGKLPPAAAALLRDGGNEHHLSAASLWEIAIKCRLGKLKLTHELGALPELLDGLPAKPPLHQRAERDPLALSKLASLAKKRIGNFNGRLHAYGTDCMGAHAVGCWDPEGKSRGFRCRRRRATPDDRIGRARASPLSPCGRGVGGEGLRRKARLAWRLTAPDP